MCLKVLFLAMKLVVSNVVTCGVINMLKSFMIESISFKRNLSFNNILPINLVTPLRVLLYKIKNPLKISKECMSSTKSKRGIHRMT